MSSETIPNGWQRGFEWSVIVFVAAAAVAAGSQFVGVIGGVDAAWRWCVVTGGVLVYEFWFLYRQLSLHARQDGRGWDLLAPANAITVFRGMLYAAAGGFLFVSPVEGIRLLPGLCYGVGAVFDVLDGWVARRFGRPSELGARLDMGFDLLGMLIAPLVAVVWGQLPVWYLAIGIIGYLFRGGVAYRRYRGREVAPLEKSRVRRPLAALQMIVVTVALLPILSPSVMTPLATVTLIPSLAVFVRDWLVVSGRTASGTPSGSSSTTGGETAMGGSGGS